jgi:hypothetical protein
LHKLIPGGIPHLLFNVHGNVIIPTGTMMPGNIEITSGIQNIMTGIIITVKYMFIMTGMDAVCIHKLNGIVMTFPIASGKE